MSYNKFKSSEFKDVNSLGYAIKSIGDVICNGTSNINGNMNVTGLGTFIGNSNALLPITNTGGNSELSIYWNVFTGGTGETSFLNYGQGGPGGFCFYTGNANTIPKCIAYLDTNSNLSRLNNVACVSVTSTGGITKSNAAITNNSTLAQVGAATFNSLSATSINNSGTLNVSGTTTLTGVLYTYGGITNSNYAIVNNSTLTQVGTSVFADVVRVSPGKSLYISDNTFTNYLRMHHTGVGGNSIIDFTGDMYFRSGGATTPLTINGGTNQGTFNYNLNTTGTTNSTNAITNNSTLAQVGTSAFTGLITSNGGITNNNTAITNNSTLSQVGTSAFTGLITSTGGITNNGVLTQNSTCNINSALNVSGLPKFDGATNQTLPSSNTGGNAGLAIYWNSAGLSQGETCFLNMAQGGVGGFSFYSSTSSSTGGAPRKLMYLDSASNLSNLNNISCNTLTATTYNVGSTSYTGSIYMANASPIYLKSSTDLNHYIKYDSVYDGPQLGFYTGLSLKCTNNNAIILNTSKTDMNINVNTKINGNLNVSGGMNNSLYYSVKGSTYNNSTATTTYYYIKYDGSSGSYASETFQMQSYAICAKITYSYYSDFPSNVYQGTSEYVVYGANFSAVSMAWSVGAMQCQPVITCSSSGLITVQFAKNTALTGHITWSVGVLII